MQEIADKAAVVTPMLLNPRADVEREGGQFGRAPPPTLSRKNSPRPGHRFPQS